MAEVILTDVTKYYGTTMAVERVSLTVNDNEFVTLVGPSGCGKTTTLNMIAGLIELTSGTIKIGDKVVNDLDPKDRDIAMVFQNYALYPHKSVRQNLEFPMRMRRVPKETRDKQVERTAEILGITHLLDRKPRQLSGGQQQRVALGRAIVRDPAVFLMDEPLSNLDAKLRVHMRAELKHLQESLGATVVYVTHDQLEAMTMSDRVAVMNLGHLQQYGTPAEVFHAPANTFVAGFIGSPPMNLIPMSITHENGHYTLSSPHMRYTPQTPRIQSLLEKSPNRNVVVGVRHTAIPLVTSAAANGSIPGQIYTIEPTGDITFVHVQVGDHLFTASTNDMNFEAQIGDQIAMQFDERYLHVFDADTTGAIRD
jgi:multiple sugar transport system ATP-binding protein